MTTPSLSFVPSPNCSISKLSFWLCGRRRMFRKCCCALGTARVARLNDDRLCWDVDGCPITIVLGPPPHDLPRGELRGVPEEVIGLLESWTMWRDGRLTRMARLRLLDAGTSPKTIWLGPPPHELTGSCDGVCPASYWSCKSGFDVLSSAEDARRAFGGIGLSVGPRMKRFRAAVRGWNGGKSSSCC